MYLKLRCLDLCLWQESTTLISVRNLHFLEVESPKSFLFRHFHNPNMLNQTSFPNFRIIVCIRYRLHDMHSENYGKSMRVSSAQLS